MKKYILLLILLLISQSYADSVDYGKITITLLNRPPKIISLEIKPDKPYYDSTLECNAVIDDDSPDTAELKYSWLVNNVLIKETSEKLTGLNEKDHVRCEVIAIDDEGEKSNMMTTETTIHDTPMHVKIIKPVLNLIGVQTNTEELTPDMNLVTGMVTGNRGAQYNLMFMLSVFLLILIGVNVFAYLTNRRTRRPTQDSALS